MSEISSLTSFYEEYSVDYTDDSTYSALNISNNDTNSNEQSENNNFHDDNNND